MLVRVAVLALGMLGGVMQMGDVTMHHAEGTFEVKMKPEPLSEVAGKSTLQRMSLDKVFHGQLEGTSKGEFLASGSADGSGGYVAMERT